jgi:hypothetical protein
MTLAAEERVHASGKAVTSLRRPVAGYFLKCLFIVAILGADRSVDGARPQLQLTVRTDTASIPFSPNLFLDPEHPYFVATLTNVSGKPLRVSTDPSAVGVQSVRLDGQTLTPKIQNVEYDNDPCIAASSNVAELAAGASIRLPIRGFSKLTLSIKGGNRLATFSAPRPGHYEVVFEYSFYCKSEHANLVSGPLFSNKVKVLVTSPKRE